MSRQTGVVQQLVVLAFDDPAEAGELLSAALALQASGGLSLDDVVVVTKRADGTTHRIETTDLTPAEGALAGAFWGVLFGTVLLGPFGGMATGAVAALGGAAIGRVIDRGIDDAFVKQMKREIEPDTTAVIFLVNFAHAEPTLSELGRFGGRLVHSTLPERSQRRIEAALREGEVARRARVAARA